MGLDMYLTRETYIGAEFSHRQIDGTIFITKEGARVPINFNQISEIIESVAYWRKANAIHKWFVDNVQKGKDDCKEYRVTRRNLLDLCDLVSDVLDHCELKEGKIRNGYQLKKFLWFHYKKYNKVDGKVLTKDSIKYCQEKLPTQEGFFFGSTDYDEHYYDDLVYTKERLNHILENYNLSKDKVYYSSSW